MAYIGRPLQVSNLAVQSGTGDGSDTTPIATLDYATTTNGIAVYLDGVRQLAGTDYTVSGTTLTFTTAPPNGVGIDVYFLGLELSLPSPADATVTKAKITTTLINEHVDTTITAADSILFADATDSNANKKDTVQGILDLAGGAWQFIASASPSGAATVDFLNNFSATYDDYILMFHNVIPASDGNIFRVRVAISGSAQTGSSYDYATMGYKDNNTANSTGGTGADSLLIMNGNTGTDTGESHSGHLWIYGVNNTANYKHLIMQSNLASSSTESKIHLGGGYYYGSTSALSGVQLYMGSGNVESGEFKLYGLAKT